MHTQGLAGPSHLPGGDFAPPMVQHPMIYVLPRLLIFPSTSVQDPSYHPNSAKNLFDCEGGAQDNFLLILSQGQRQLSTGTAMMMIDA